MGLTTKQRKFAEAFASTGKLLESYRAAGYRIGKMSTAQRAAEAVKANPVVQSYLKELYEQVASKSVATRREILERLSGIIRQESQEEQVVVEQKGDYTSEARIIKVRASHASALKAMKLFLDMTGGVEEKPADDSAAIVLSKTCRKTRRRRRPMAKIVRLSQVVGGGYSEFWKDQRRYECIKGGRASKKSKTAALRMIFRLMKYPKSNALIVRRTFATLRDSCYSDLKWATERLGVAHLWKFSVSPLEVTYLPTGQKILSAAWTTRSKSHRSVCRTACFASSGSRRPMRSRTKIPSTSST